MCKLGAGRPARFWSEIGERVAQFHQGGRYVRHLDYDGLIRQAVCQVNGRTREQSSTASQSKLNPLVLTLVCLSYVMRVHM